MAMARANRSWKNEGSFRADPVWSDEPAPAPARDPKRPEINSQ